MCIELRVHLTTIPVELGFLVDFEHLKLKTCSIYPGNIFIKKVNGMIIQVFNSTFGSSHSASSAYQKWPTLIGCEEVLQKYRYTVLRTDTKTQGLDF